VELQCYWRSGNEFAGCDAAGELPRLAGNRRRRSRAWFTFGVSLLTGIIFGLLPAWVASRRGVSDALKEGGRSATAGSARQRLRSMFVIGELAVALILLIGAGLLIKTFWNLRSVAPGFNPDHLLSMRVELPEARYKEKDKQTRFRTQALANIGSLPGVQAAMVSELPLSGDSLDHDFLIDGRPRSPPETSQVWKRAACWATISKSCKCRYGSDEILVRRILMTRRRE